MEKRVRISDSFAGRSIFLTGATGFIGKVLVEKLLRSCPTIDKIYVLLRAKKGKTATERLAELTNYPLFELLKEQYPTFIDDKLRAMEGDIRQNGLGLSDEDRQTIIDNVSIIYHNAASVRFDDPLKEAILINTKSTREIALLAKQVKHLEVFLYVSTAYTNAADRDTIEERVYPPCGNWREAIQLAETIDTHLFDVIAKKYTYPHPNTYTFTKNLAEHVVQDLCADQIPTVIVRPSIVISSVDDPIAGWVDNFNGPIGLLVASATGVVRSLYGSPTVKCDYVPVDRIVRGLIMATAGKINQTNRDRKMALDVYNGSQYQLHRITMEEMLNMAKELKWEVPLKKILWYPGGGVTNNILLYYLKVIFCHLLPALILDVCFKLSGHTPMLGKLQRRVYTANMALVPFLFTEWGFVNHRFLALEKQLHSADIGAFAYEADTFNVFDYFRSAIVGGKRFLLKEDVQAIDKDKKQLFRLYLLYIVMSVLFYGFLSWMVAFKFTPYMYRTVANMLRDI